MMASSDDELKEKINKLIEKYKNINLGKGKSLIYVLKLKGDKYYIGQTTNFEKRMFDHFKGNRRSSLWTKENSPVSICEVINMEKKGKSECAKSESAKTIEYMRNYGVDNVRGGHYCRKDSNEIKRLLYIHGFECNDGKPNTIGDKHEYMKKIDELSKNLLIDQWYPLGASETNSVSS